MVTSSRDPVRTRERILRAARREFVAKLRCTPGGTFHMRADEITLHSGDAYTFVELKGMLERSGFSKNELREVPGAPNRVVISKV